MNTTTMTRVTAPCGCAYTLVSEDTASGENVDRYTTESVRCDAHSGCSYCGEKHADGSCITVETAGSGGMLPLTAAEQIAAARAELNRCTSVDGCVRPSLPKSMLCAEHVLAAHDAATAAR